MTILQDIILTKKIEVSNLKKNQYDIKRSKPIYKIDFNKFFLISELKPKSPLTGIIRQSFDIKLIVDEFKNNNSSAISVLTDQVYFGGSIGLLNNISNISKLPILRKDFIIDELQIDEAFVNGADLILLIVKILTPQKLKELAIKSLNLGLSIIIEINTKEELVTIISLINENKLDPTSVIIGINNRNLETFVVDFENSKKLSRLIPSNFYKIALSGVKNKQDIIEIKNLGFNGVLIGHALVNSQELSLNLIF